MEKKFKRDRFDKEEVSKPIKKNKSQKQKYKKYIELTDDEETDILMELFPNRHKTLKEAEEEAEDINNFLNNQNNKEDS